MEFQYLVFDREGRRVSAIASADSVYALISRLKNQGLTPLEVSEVKPTKAQVFKNKIALGSGIKARELMVFTRQLATILSSGILLMEAIRTIADDLENARFRAILGRILADINAGKTLSAALTRYPAVFSATYVAMVKSGEEVGNLGQTLSDLAKYLEDYERMREKFVSAMRYPIFLSCFMILIVSVIVVFLIPKFNWLFQNAGVKLPLLTRIVVGISEFWLKNSVLGIASIIALWVLARYLLKFFRIRFLFDYSKFKLPLFGKLLLKALLGQFSRTLSILLSGGAGVISALAVSRGVVKNMFLQQVIAQAKDSVIAGASLSETLKPYAIIPRVMVKMVAVGEKTGKLDEMLKRTADYYDRELEMALDRLTSLLEPIFIVLIGGIVLIVALALYLPIFKLSMAVK